MKDIEVLSSATRTNSNCYPNEILGTDKLFKFDHDPFIFLGIYYYFLKILWQNFVFTKTSWELVSL